MPTNPDREVLDLVPQEGQLRYLKLKGPVGEKLQRWEYSFEDARWGWYDIPEVSERRTGNNEPNPANQGPPDDPPPPRGPQSE